jgi:hypothetical protein
MTFGEVLVSVQVPALAIALVIWMTLPNRNLQNRLVCSRQCLYPQGPCTNVKSQFPAITALLFISPPDCISSRSAAFSNSIPLDSLTQLWQLCKSTDTELSGYSNVQCFLKSDHPKEKTFS